MSHREGHTIGGGAAPTLPAPARPWEETYPTLPPTQQKQLVDLAKRQGYLLAEQIPIVPTPSTDTIRPFLQNALVNRLAPIPLAEPIVPRDLSLDVLQQDAVARALDTPDLFLLAGPTGTGKSRVAVEVVKQAIAQGQHKVLFLSPDPATLDGLLPCLNDLVVVRRLGPGESVEKLSPSSAALVPGRREALIRENLVRRSSEALAEAEERVRLADALRTAWTDWVAVRERLAVRTAEHASLSAKRQAVPEDVRQEAESAGDSPPYFVQRLRGVATAHSRRVAALDATAAELSTARVEAEGRRRAAESIVHDLKPGAEALHSGRWYRLSFWKARFDGTLAARLSEATTNLTVATTTLDELSVREQKLGGDRQQADEEYAAERARFLDAEVARRVADLSTLILEAERENEVEAKREATLNVAVRAARLDPSDSSAIDAELASARQNLEFAAEWALQVQNHIDQFVREACSTVQVVVGPVAAIATDPTVAANAPFDLLVVDDAHRLAEADFVAAGRLTRRWVLVGEPTDVPTGRHRASRPDLFARLMAARRHEIWSHDGARLVCRLYPVRGADRKRLECEPVADAPDIELRLFTPPDGDPTLAEVAFPATMAPAAAREYLFRELGEMTCEPRGRSASWEDSPAGLVFRFGPTDPLVAFAAIGPGIREELAGLETRAIHFAADWTLDQAKAWVAENVGRRVGARVAVLDRPYRACPGLACWLNRAFATGFATIPPSDIAPHVEFLAVPDTDTRRRRDPGRPTRVGGAGYEIDLADPRQRAALPSDMIDLPASGFVNLPEAQALVRYLEPLANQGLAISSPFPAQIAVLRRLLARSPRLAHVPVLDPAEAARHECDLMAVSLTRSHVARAVPFGDGPSVLAGLLGRARKKLLFAGDPGTLARRLQWEGPVDHLDATDAARERAWVAALADCPRVSSPRHRHASHESLPRMTPAGSVPDRILSAFHRQFPARQHLWAGILRLWRVEAAHSSPSLLAASIARCANPSSLGLPAAIINSIRAAGIIRQTCAYLDLPSGPLAIPVPARAFDPWPEPILAVPSLVLHPAGSDQIRIEGNWRTAPIVRVEMVPMVAIQVGNTIDAFVADEEGLALGQITPQDVPTVRPTDWMTAWRSWAEERGLPITNLADGQLEGGTLRMAGLDPTAGEVWLWAGDGPVREVAIVLQTAADM